MMKQDLETWPVFPLQRIIYEVLLLKICLASKFSLFSPLYYFKYHPSQVISILKA